MSLRIVAFLDFVAWTALGVSLLAFALGLFLDVTYAGSVDYKVDTLRGRRRTFKWGRYLLLSLACGAWLWTGRAA